MGSNLLGILFMLAVLTGAHGKGSPKKFKLNPRLIQTKVAFFAGLDGPFGPVARDSDIIFSRVVTNVGTAYSNLSGRFTAPVNGTYQFNVAISPQLGKKASVMLVHNGKRVIMLWAEAVSQISIATSSNSAILSLSATNQVWVVLLHNDYSLYGSMYSTFSGSLLFRD